MATEKATKKAKEIAKYTQRGYLVVDIDNNTEVVSSYNDCYNSAMQMYKWCKQDMLKKYRKELNEIYKHYLQEQKQLVIEKACEFIKTHTHTRNEGAAHCVVSNGETQDDFIKKLKQAVEE